MIGFFEMINQSRLKCRIPIVARFEPGPSAYERKYDDTAIFDVIDQPPWWRLWARDEVL
jgi:hypothetical protein